MAFNMLSFKQKLCEILSSKDLRAFAPVNVPEASATPRSAFTSRTLCTTITKKKCEWDGIGPRVERVQDSALPVRDCLDILNAHHLEQGTRDALCRSGYDRRVREDAVKDVFADKFPWLPRKPERRSSRVQLVHEAPVLPEVHRRSVW